MMAMALLGIGVFFSVFRFIDWKSLPWPPPSGGQEREVQRVPSYIPVAIVGQIPRGFAIYL